VLTQTGIHLFYIRDSYILHQLPDPLKMAYNTVSRCSPSQSCECDPIVDRLSDCKLVERRRQDLLLKGLRVLPAEGTYRYVGEGLNEVKATNREVCRTREK